MHEKLCTRCMQTLSIDLFALRSVITKKPQSWCRECARKNWQDKGPDNKANARRYYLKHRETFCKKAKEYREKTLPQRLVLNAKWRAENPVKYRESMRRAGRKYARQHREKVNAKQLRRKARGLSLPHEWTADIARDALEHWENKCAVCSCDLAGKLHWDHWIPIAAKDCPGTVRSNMLPLCSSCNTSKRHMQGSAWIYQNHPDQAAFILGRIETYLQGVHA